MFDYYLHRDEAWIHRDDTSATLMDNEGEKHYQFPATWTDEQIYNALDFANRAYEYGVKAGRTELRNDLKKFLKKFLDIQ